MHSPSPHRATQSLCAHSRGIHNKLSMTMFSVISLDTCAFASFYFMRALRVARERVRPEASLALHGRWGAFASVMPLASRCTRSLSLLVILLVI